MWVGYLDFMRNQWPNLRDLEEVESKFREFDKLAPPYKSAFTDWVGLRTRDHREAYKRFKVRN
jgi:hypothetical protein